MGNALRGKCATYLRVKLDLVAPVASVLMLLKLVSVTMTAPPLETSSLEPSASVAGKESVSMRLAQ